MAGFTITQPETALLGAIVEACQTQGEAPVSIEAFELLATLLRVEELCLMGFDRNPDREYFSQERAGDAYTFVDGDRAGHPCAKDFWKTYWDVSCSHAERTGDYQSVLTDSELISGVYVRELWATAALAHGRRLRLTGKRDGVEFTERETFYVTLLKPHLTASYRRWRLAHPPDPGLTVRQQNVLALVRDGLTNGQIARRLELSEGTVRTHLNHIHERLGVTNRTSAVQAVFSDVEGAY